MTPSEIKPDMIFGNWKVIKYDHTNKHRIKYFLCECLVCGKKRPVRGTSLISGYSTACSSQCINDLTGQKFGSWTVLKKDKSRPRYYICRCECGTVRSVYKGSLTTGKTKSCGCLSVLHSKKSNEKKAQAHIGETWGFLTIDDYKLEKDKKYYYHCHCKCGNEILVQGTRLFNGTTVSCGCINSKANETMAKILTKYGIVFKREYCFEDCRDKRPLPFDFALFNNQNELIGLIENNGSQHYCAAGTGWNNTQERLFYTQKHDYLKRKFCEDNYIPLLIIPYQFFNEIEKFLITSDFWQIITKNFND